MGLGDELAPASHFSLAWPWWKCPDSHRLWCHLVEAVASGHDTGKDGHGRLAVVGCSAFPVRLILGYRPEFPIFTPGWFFLPLGGGIRIRGWSSYWKAYMPTFEGSESVRCGCISGQAEFKPPERKKSHILFLTLNWFTGFSILRRPCIFVPYSFKNNLFKTVFAECNACSFAQSNFFDNLLTNLPFRRTKVNFVNWKKACVFLMFGTHCFFGQRRIPCHNWRNPHLRPLWVRKGPSCSTEIVQVLKDLAQSSGGISCVSAQIRKERNNPMSSEKMFSGVGLTKTRLRMQKLLLFFHCRRKRWEAKFQCWMLQPTDRREKLMWLMLPWFLRISNVVTSKACSQKRRNS